MKNFLYFDFENQIRKNFKKENKLDTQYSLDNLHSFKHYSCGKRISENYKISQDISFLQSLGGL